MMLAILAMLRNGLKNHFGASPKSTIIDRADSVSVACPFCDDSRKNVYKKRGTLFKSTLAYRCFNCGYTTSLYGLMKHLGESMPEEMREPLKAYIDEGKRNGKRYKSSVLAQMSSEDELDYRALFNKIGVSPFDVINKLKLTPVTKNPVALAYLKGRMVKDDVIGRLLCDDKRIYIVNLSPDNKRIIGMNGRLYAKSQSEPKYKLYNINKLYELTSNVRLSQKIYSDFLLYNEKYKDFVDTIVKIIDSISVCSGFFSVDVNRPFYILEGEFDKTFVPNSMSLSGVEKEIDLGLYELGDCRVMFDNDVAGLKKSFELIDEYNAQCFSWTAFCKDHGLDKDSIKDVNDLVLATGNQNIMCELDDKYFTNIKYFL